MVSLLFALILSTVTSEQQMQQNYASVYKQSIEENKPLMVIVSADWCPACQVLKNSTLKQMAQTGELNDVCVAVINKDLEPELVQQLTKGENLLPQIIMFTKSESGQWNRRRLIGFQPKQPVRSLIRKAILDRQG
ncbi:Thioredoxin [Novipirellula galeiformis]|uniref:Thioredoxin n=1 Tax=Novipirellula galeiformis TaxID=2528004 RepID=A0A5C6C9Z2_9BACT|nr:thioredoxin family protein [Novipirellula galeiformis]TWU20196.1 Thioredoxin [Novipirellula galeiformis]